MGGGVINVLARFLVSFHRVDFAISVFKSSHVSIFSFLFLFFFFKSSPNVTATGFYCLRDCGW